MGARTTAREAALQMLFAIETGGSEAERAIADFWRELPGDAEGRAYADELVRGAMAELIQIDELGIDLRGRWKAELPQPE